MLKSYLLFLFSLVALGASVSPSDCAQLRQFKDDFESSARDTPVKSLPSFDDNVSNHDKRVALHQYLFYVHQQATNLAALAHGFNTRNEKSMAPAEKKLHDTINALGQEIADMDDHKDSDLPLTDDEKELAGEAAHISSRLEQLEEVMVREIETQCPVKAHAPRQEEPEGEQPERGQPEEEEPEEEEPEQEDPEEEELEEEEPEDEEPEDEEPEEEEEEEPEEEEPEEDPEEEEPEEEEPEDEELVN